MQRPTETKTFKIEWDGFEQTGRVPDVLVYLTSEQAKKGVTLVADYSEDGNELRGVKMFSLDSRYKTTQEARAYWRESVTHNFWFEPLHIDFGSLYSVETVIVGCTFDGRSTCYATSKEPVPEQFWQPFAGQVEIDKLRILRDA